MTENNAAQPVLTDDAIERIRIRAEKDSRRFGRTVDIPIRADLLLALLSKLRAPVTHYECGRSNGDGTCEAVPVRAPVADERAELPPLSAKDAEPSPHGPYEVYESEYVQEYARSAVLADRQKRAALASAPVAGEAQPVAWLHQCRKKPELTQITMKKHEPSLAAKGYRPVPLYAAPQASEAVRDAVARAQEWMTEKNVKAFPRTACAHIAGLSKLLLASGRRTSADLNHPVFAFLLGEGTLRGVEFGDRHPEERGAYWWRKDLRAALSAQPSGNPGELAAQPGAQKEQHTDGGAVYE